MDMVDSALERTTCDVDMVDSALERPDVALSKRGTIGLNGVPLRALRSFLLTQNRVAEFFFEDFFPKYSVSISPTALRGAPPPQPTFPGYDSANLRNPDCTKKKTKECLHPTAHARDSSRPISGLPNNTTSVRVAHEPHQDVPFVFSSR